MKKWLAKLSKNKKIGLLAGAVAVVAVIAVVLVLVLGEKEEAYRNIKVSEVEGEVIVNREGLEEMKAYEEFNMYCRPYCLR